MKHTIGWICMLFPVFALAQSKAAIDSTAKSVLNDLISSWTLGVDSTSETVNIKVYNQFKSLFAPNATIDDDFNVFFVYDAKKKSGTYRIETVARPKVYDVYAHDVALQVRSLIIDSVTILDSHTADRSNILFRVRRRVSVQKTRQYVLPDDYADEVLSGRTIAFEGKGDSLKMVSSLKTKTAQNPQAVYEFTSFNTVLIAMSYDSGSVHISGLKSVTNEVACTNDADNDAVLNQDDSLQNKPGDFTASGKPDYDLDGIADGYDKCRLTYGDARNRGCPAAYFLTKGSFDGSFGIQSGSVNITLPGAEGLSYLDDKGKNAVDLTRPLFKKGVLKNPGNRLAVYGGGSFTHYFGQKRKRTGISIGLNYSAVTADYELRDTIMYTFKASDGLNFYRRQITISRLKEEMKYGLFNMPVLFNFRSHLDKNHKLVLNLRAGPSLMVFRNTSYYNTIIDFGGLYQLDPSCHCQIVYTDRYDSSSRDNIYFTSKYIRSRNPSPNAASEIFNMLDSVKYSTPGSGLSYLDFASDKLYNGKQHMTRFAVAANLNIDFQYKFSEGFTLKFGPHFLYASYLPARIKYKPIDKTFDEYQSIYKGNAKSNYSAYGVSLGFVYDF